MELRDVPWVKASGANGHEFCFRTSLTSLSETARARFSLGRDIDPEKLLAQVFHGRGDYDGQNEMYGLASLFNTRDPSNAQNAVNVLDAEGRDGPLSSVWLVGWRADGVYMVSRDGEPLTTRGDAALIVQDWRCVVRIANVDVLSRPLPLAPLIAVAMLRLPNPTALHMRPMLYMNSDVRNALRDEWPDFPRWLPPIRIIDELRVPESRVE